MNSPWLPTLPPASSSSSSSQSISAPPAGFPWCSHSPVRAGPGSGAAQVLTPTGNNTQHSSNSSLGTGTILQHRQHKHKRLCHLLGLQESHPSLATSCHPQPSDRGSPEHPQHQHSFTSQGSTGNHWPGSVSTGTTPTTTTAKHPKNTTPVTATQPG